MSDEATRFFVGRNGRWVPDPLTGGIRALLGEERARDLDYLATLAGEDVVGWPDGVLEAQREPFADFDAERAAESLAWERQTEAWENSWRADEEVRVVRGLLRTDPSPQLERRLSEAHRRAVELEAIRERFYDEMEKAGGFYLIDSFETYPNLPYDRQPRSALVLGVAAARERAIRAATPGPLEWAASDGIDASPVVAGGPAPMYREVGTANLAEIRERQRAARARTYSITRDHVSAPKALDKLRRFIGDERCQILEARSQDLADWLDGRAGDMVRKRAAELGHPDQDLPRDAALHERRLAYALATSKLERDVAREDAERDTDPQLGAVARQRAKDAERRIARLERELGPHRERLDAWVNSDDTVRRIAYTDEVAAQHAVKVARHVALARDDPPLHLVDLIGPPNPDSAPRIVAQHIPLARDDPPQPLDDFAALRDPDAPEVGWDHIARRVEDLRLSGQFDPQQGTSAHSLAEQLPAELQRDINDLRERIGIEPLQTTTPQAAVYSAGLDVG